MRKCLMVVVLMLLVITAAFGAEKQKEPFTVLTSEELKAMLDKHEPGLTIIDARTPEEYQQVHIRGAVNLPWPTMEKDPATLNFPKEAPLVFYCNGFKCGKSPKAARLAATLGYRRLYVLSEGMPVWEEKGFSIYAGPDYEKRVQATIVSPKELNSLLSADKEKITLVDVRDPQEYTEGHIPGAINIPVTRFAAASGSLEKEKKIIVYCNSGGRSYNAYRKLQKMDYRNIGQAIFSEWKEQGLPVSPGAAP